MQFEILTELQIGVFYQISLEGRSGYIIYPIHKVPIDTMLTVEDFEPTSHLTTGFKVGQFCTTEKVVEHPLLGYLFYSKLPIMNYGTGAMSYSMAWQRSEGEHKVRSDQVRAVYRNEHFYMYEAPTIATLITGSEVSDELNDYLTMI